MTTPGYDYDKAIPAGFYDEIHQRKAGVRFFWHDLKFRAVGARLEGAGKVLDIGCGPGTFIGNWASTAWASISARPRSTTQTGATAPPGIASRRRRSPDSMPASTPSP
jgi:hypothetical protein